MPTGRRTRGLDGALGSSTGRSLFGARATAPITTATNAATRTMPATPLGSGSANSVIAATIGIALVPSVAMPAVVSARPRWKPICRTTVPRA